MRYPDNMAKTADWYASIPSVLEQYPQIKSVTLWASIDAQDEACSYTFYDDPTLTAGVRHAVTTGVLNQKAVKLP